MSKSNIAANVAVVSVPTIDVTEESFNFIPVYVGDQAARTIVGGGKPIDKGRFNDLRRAGLIATFHPLPGRCLYKVSQLYQYIESTAATAGGILPSYTSTSQKRNSPNIQ